MFQVIYNAPLTQTEDGNLHIETHFVHNVPVSFATARRRANNFLAGFVTLTAVAGEPALVVGDKLVWRVPAGLHLPKLGLVGTIGFVDVDAETGIVLQPSPEQINQMQNLAHAIAT